MSMLDRIECVQCKLLESVEDELDYGIDKVHTEELGQVIDMIKDLSQVKKYESEAEYYRLVTEAMEHSEDAHDIVNGMAKSHNPVVATGSTLMH